MRYIRLFFTTVLISSIFWGCNNSRTTTNNWNCKTIDDERICIPSSWIFKQQSKTLFFSYLDNKDNNCYFAILKYNKTASGLNATKYLKELYLILQKKDTLETTQGYTLKKVTSNKLDSYHNEIYTSIHRKTYITFSTVFEKDDDLFEIVLKIDISNSNKYKELYRDILFKFRHKDHPIFSPDDKIDNVKTIDLSKW